MDFYQASTKSTSILNNTWTNSSGQVIYKVSTPFKVTGRKSTIWRITPSGTVSSEPSTTTSTRRRTSQKGLPVESDSDEDSAPVDLVEEQIDFRDNFRVLAEIEWKLMVSSIFKYDGEEEIAATAFLKKKTWGCYGR